MSRVVAIVRAVGSSLADCELNFVARETIDLAEANRQHVAYCDALRRAGISVEVLSAAQHLPDSVFVEDTAVVLDELAVIARPRSEVRREEVATVVAALERYRVLARIEAPAILEGGDILRIGQQIFVGLSSRTNEEGYAQFTRIVEHRGYRVIPVGVDGCLHLKTAVTALDRETLLLNPNWIDVTKMAGFRGLRVPEAEPFAANSLVLNGVVHLSSRWGRTRDLLEQHGFRTSVLTITEFEKAEAGLTCLSLVFRCELDGESAE